MDGKKSLLKGAKKVLKENQRGNYTIPAAGIYPHQWLWDSCFIAIGLRHYDVERAKMEIVSLLRGQWFNGMIPHMILSFSGSSSRHDRNARAWQSWRNPMSPDEASTSGITQPPMLAEAVASIGEKMTAPERRSWYKMVLPALIRYHQWLYAERDPHQEGLVLQIHPWETGLDNTPPWMDELHRHMLAWWIRALRKLRLDNSLTWFRSDTRYVPAAQRLTNIEALALYDIQRRMRRKSYNIDDILDHGWFAIEDLTFNSIFIRANTRLQEIAETAGQKLPADLLDTMKKSEKAIENFWNEADGQYYSRDFITHHPLQQSSIAALMPLYSGAISKERAGVLVHLLESEHLFGTSYPIPTAPANSEYFDPIRYWQGPAWFNTNWLIIDGLKRYGFHDHAAALRESTLELAKNHGFYEYFNPLNGDPLGSQNFSWTAALTIDLLQK